MDRGAASAHGGLGEPDVTPAAAPPGLRQATHICRKDRLSPERHPGGNDGGAASGKSALNGPGTSSRFGTGRHGVPERLGWSPRGRRNGDREMLVASDNPGARRVSEFGRNGRNALHRGEAVGQCGGGGADFAPDLDEQALRIGRRRRSHHRLAGRNRIFEIARPQKTRQPPTLRKNSQRMLLGGTTGTVRTPEGDFAEICCPSSGTRHDSAKVENP